MYSNMLVNCSNCRTPLQLPPGARSIRCAFCQAITQIADHSRNAPPPPSIPTTPPPSTIAPPSPYNHAPPGPPPNQHGRKKAVIVGISYKYSRHELKGCINDANCMRHLLMTKFQFPQESILMLTVGAVEFALRLMLAFHLHFPRESVGILKLLSSCGHWFCLLLISFALELLLPFVLHAEEETDPYKIPTKQNMRMALFWLVQGCQPGDSLLFHYSGHGSRQRNYNGDEVDGYDETLCPLDFETQGMIVDDEINATIVRPLPQGVRLHAIIDACHSGTVLDLPFLCRMDRNGQYVWEDHRPQSGIWKGTNGGDVISISGCDDHQTSADTSALSKITSTGAMTFCFIQAIERGHGATYGSILNAMRTTIRNTANNPGGGDVVTSLIGMLLTGGSGGGGGGLRQEPQLTSYQPFDVYTRPFSL
ncbi:hypothetical protein DKX38_020712 [Salix brachista]|uniref:Uncharacterized protein n=1 Tax=Salix brachista TaxID=2182728 RepID=A0A5N5KB58_9ROSI|nr:hypothetical protein DKX38_020712 [Salix brachista]